MLIKIKHQQHNYQLGGQRQKNANNTTMNQGVGDFFDMR